MLTPDQALKVILGRARPLGPEWIDLRDANDRVLAVPVRAADHLPRFDNSAMDGFAVRSADLRKASRQAPVMLRLGGEARAGSPKIPGLQRGCAIRISTGAPIPPGADAVVMKEDVEVCGKVARFREPAPKRDNIRRCGEEIRKGKIALQAGTLLNPGTIGWLATMGIRSIRVFRRPRVGILRSGDEVARWGARPAPNQVRDAHGVSLGLALRQMGFEVDMPPCVSDQLGAVTRAFSKMLAGCDIVLTTGGVSVGDHDLFRSAAASAGIKTLFWNVAQKPGKPFCFGTRGRKLWFGLPGNPVSSLVCFYLYVRPALLQAMGRQRTAPVWVESATVPGMRPHPSKTQFLRGQLVNGHARIAAKQGSHCLGSFAGSDVLVRIDPECAKRKRNGAVKITPTGQF